MDNEEYAITRQTFRWVLRRSIAEQGRSPIAQVGLAAEFLIEALKQIDELYRNFQPENLEHWNNEIAKACEQLEKTGYTFLEAVEQSHFFDNTQLEPLHQMLEHPDPVTSQPFKSRDVHKAVHKIRHGVRLELIRQFHYESKASGPHSIKEAYPEVPAIAEPTPAKALPTPKKPNRKRARKKRQRQPGLSYELTVTAAADLVHIDAGIISRAASVGKIANNGQKRNARRLNKASLLTFAKNHRPRPETPESVQKKLDRSERN